MKVPAPPGAPGGSRQFRKAVNSPDGQSGGERARIPPPPFRLIRYFSVSSLLGILVVLAVLLFFYRHFSINALMDHETRGNIALARVFANTIWPNHAAYVKGASAIPKAELAQSPEIDPLRRDVLRQMTGLNVVKVKIYNLAGLTVFSTDPKQIGEDKSTNGGFVNAKAGRTVSEITFRDSFDAFEQVINDRNLVSSYIPISTSKDAPVEGVMEVYSDVTDFVATLERTQWQIVGGVLGSLSLLYAFLFTIVRRADRLIRAQGERMRQAHEDLLFHQAHHDALTGLPNRLNFSERVDDMVYAAKRGGTMVAVLCLDVGGLKKVNDSLGNAMGDRLLKEVSKRLTEGLRDAEITARRGGAEFGAALSGIRGVEQVAIVAEKIRQAVLNPLYAIDSHNLAVSINIGISIYPDDGTSGAEMISSADAAMHHAKILGRNTYQFHTADMNARALAMLLTEQDLRLALDREEFLLHFQPVLDAHTGRIVGMEALIRWRHPQRGLVSPAQFIPIAEAGGLIVPIGTWVLRDACRQNRAWQKAGMPAISIAVNLSALQFHQKNLTQEVARALQDSGLAAEYLDLELTESAVMQDAEDSLATMHALKAIGVKLSLDDFGTGYSSLNQLKLFPLDKLKIDQSFVRGLPNDRYDLAISTAIIGMGKALNLRLIAEGVETAEQLQVLQSIGCHEIQGYFVCRPVPAAEFAEFERERRFQVDLFAPLTD
jgi:diguanylate cyclase (GGDEF)-like protein